MSNPTDNAWLDEIILKPAHWQADDYAKAKQAILTHIDTVCRETRIDEARLWDRYGENAKWGKERLEDITAQLNPNKEPDDEVVFEDLKGVAPKDILDAIDPVERVRKQRDEWEKV